MDNTSGEYAPLTVETLPGRLSSIGGASAHLGPDIASWRTREVGDGNLNLVFIVDSPQGSIVVKQALPYVRLVGDSWPLPLKRAFFEYHALTRQAARDPGRVPDIYHFDEEQALIIMEHLSPHVILRNRLIKGERTERLGENLGRFCARTLFRGSDLHMEAAEKKRDLALFAGNIELCDITENLVFNDPYFEAEMNSHTTPQLDPLVSRLRADMSLKVEVQHLKRAFCCNAETLLHGDLHTGSVMATDTDTKIIDPEFAFYGPMGFDVGMLLSNFLMSYYSQQAHAAVPGDRDDFQEWILTQTAAVWTTFAAEFATLWRTKRSGILYSSELYENQNDALASEQALGQFLHHIWSDAMGICGIEMHRRILGLAHNADFEDIEDPDLRAPCEARALMLGRQLVLDRHIIVGPEHLFDLVRHIHQEDML
ncbi:MAG: S-methyl-5-thioribose kinase [Stappiaceae bacterium]